MTDWPQIIRDIMKEHRVTQRALEAATGVSRSTLKRCFNGKSSFHIDDLESILNALGYNIDTVQAGKPVPALIRPKRLNARPMRSPKLIRGAWEVRF